MASPTSLVSKEMQIMSAAPVVRPISWLATIPQFVIYVALFGIAASMGGFDKGMLWGIGSGLVYSIGSRRLVLRAHRRGIRLTHEGEFAEAIQAHLESYDFFTQNAWIDRYRSVVLMSPAAMSYREMALCNVAYCYGQLGDGEKAEAFYRRALHEFPGSSLAQAALRMLASVKPREVTGDSNSMA